MTTERLSRLFKVLWVKEHNVMGDVTPLELSSALTFSVGLVQVSLESLLEKKILTYNKETNKKLVKMKLRK